MPLSTFGFLFGQWIQYAKSQASDVTDLEARLYGVGQSVGIRYFELVLARSKDPNRRQLKVLDILLYISDNIFRPVFGKHHIERSSSAEDEYMFRWDSDISVNEFISVPRQYGALNCAAFVAGMIGGILEHCSFAARVTAHYVQAEAGASTTTILVKFAEPVLLREAQLARAG